MSDPAFTDDELLAYLDEMLPVERMTVLEESLRQSETLRRRTAAAAYQRDSGVHSVGEIWREHRLSCPTRSRLGSYLLGTLEPNLAEYVEFHVRSVGCRFCDANLCDLEVKMEATPETRLRCQKYFQSSAGYLRQYGAGD